MSVAVDRDVAIFPATVISREGSLYTIAPIISLTTQFPNVASQFSQEFSRGDRVSVIRLQNDDGKLVITGPLSSSTELAIFNTSQVRITLNGAVPVGGTYRILRNGFEIQSGLIPVRSPIKFVADLPGLYTVSGLAPGGESGTISFFLNEGEGINALLELEIIQTCTTTFRNVVLDSDTAFEPELIVGTADSTPLV